MVGEKESAQTRIHRYVQTCELIFEQPIDYYRQQLEKKFVSELDFNRYYLMITGLPRQVYRTFFGTDAFAYSEYFRRIEIEIVHKLENLGVRCMTTMLLYDHTKRFCMIFNVPENTSAQEVAQIAADSFEALYGQLFDMTQTPYCNYTVVSDMISGYENLPKAYKEMNDLSRQQFFNMHQMIMTPMLLEKLRKPVSREQLHEDLALLRTTMRERDTKMMKTALDIIMDHLDDTRDFSMTSEMMLAIRSLAEGILVSQGRTLENPEAFLVERYPTMDHLRVGIEKKLQETIEQLYGGVTMSAPVLEAVRYIRHHYAEDVSLANVAKHIDMSPSWLTKHFNHECGMSIPAYLLQVRIEYAKKMLGQTNMMVFEVGSAVGFENPRYFVSVFKKAVGMTPKEYRDKAQDE